MQPLLLLHGAIGSSAQFSKLADQLSGSYKIYAPDLVGHGTREMPATPFSIKLFAEDVLAFMEREQLENIPVFGYSMGGYVGLYIARHYPEKISKIVTLATKFDWNEAISAKEVQMLDPAKIEQKLPTFAEDLKKRHLPNDWKEVLFKTANMMTTMGRENPLMPEDYAAINIPALLLLGDRDKMVSVEETMTVYKALPAASMGMLPGTPHSIEQVNLDALVFYIEQLMGE